MADTDDIQYDEAQLAEAQRIVAIEQRRQAERAAALRAAYQAAVADLLASEEWPKVRDALVAIRDGQEPDGGLSVHVGALADIMLRLEGFAGEHSSVDAASASSRVPPATAASA